MCDAGPGPGPALLVGLSWSTSLHMGRHVSQGVHDVFDLASTVGVKHLHVLRETVWEEEKPFQATKVEGQDPC